MDVVDKKYLPSEQVDYEINAALKSPSGNTVTAMGSLIHEGDGASPFMMMISKKPS